MHYTAGVTAPVNACSRARPDRITDRISRRAFLHTAALAATGAALPRPALAAAPDSESLRTTHDAAIATLLGNVRTLPARPSGYAEPVLIEGSTYAGVWQECGPHEALVWASLGLRRSGVPSPLQVARNNHMAFFSLQRPDGQLPASVKTTETGFGQIQMVVPIAATAWELAQMTALPGREEFLTTAYRACGRWDAWLRQYRDTRKTGLVEGFCTYDTGHDNSPRWAGLPNRCPDADARKCPAIPSLPRLCPDLSATVFGARIALAAMAGALGKHEEQARWLADAEHLRRLILTTLYSPEDAAFYDLDAQGNFVRVRSDVISRVLGEHVLDLSRANDRLVFDSVWTRQLHNPAAFWAPYPFPSIALNDPTFVCPIPRNSWGGASQALTALRTPRWMPHYGKHAEFRHLMQQWIKAISRNGEFRQQLDPQTGAFTQDDPGGYSPTALVFLDFERRLAAKA